jgi:hypothetical protein
MLWSFPETEKVVSVKGVDGVERLEIQIVRKSQDEIPEPLIRFCLDVLVNPLFRFRCEWVKKENSSFVVDKNVRRDLLFLK